MATTVKKPRQTPLKESNSKVIEMFKTNGRLETEIRLLKDQLNEARRNHQDDQMEITSLRSINRDLEKEKARLEGYVVRVKEQDRNELEKRAGNP